MLTSKLIYFLLFTFLVLSVPLTQADAESFIKDNNFVPASATLSSFKQENDKFIVFFKDQFTTYKFILGQDQMGKLFVMFREQLTEINLSNGQLQTPNGQMNVLTFPQMTLIKPNIPEIPIQPSTMNIMMPAHMMMRNPTGFHQRNNNPFVPPCKLNEQDVKILLKQNLVIFENAEITQIQKVGFERGMGMILDITLINDKKQYKVKAGYVPRIRKLNVIKLEEIKTESKSPIQTGKQLIGKVVNDLPFKAMNEMENINLRMENLIQSFVEKLLVRRNLKLGSEGEPEMAKPLLLGSEGEPQNPTPLPVEEVKAPLILGEEGQPGNPFAFGSDGESEKPQAETQDHHTEQKSQQISELVTEVLGKLKLKTK